GQAEIGLQDRLLQGGERLLVPRADHDHPRLRDRDVGHLIDREAAAEVFHLHAVQERRVRAASADGRQLAACCLERLLHVLLHLFQEVSQELFSRQQLFPPTTVPTSSPSTTRRTLPRSARSKTTIGILCSMLSENAVRSITFRRI